MKVTTLRFPDKQTAFASIKEKYGQDTVIIDTRMVREKAGLFSAFSKKVCEVVIAISPAPEPLPPAREMLAAPKKQELPAPKYSADSGVVLAGNLAKNAGSESRLPTKEEMLQSFLASDPAGGQPKAQQREAAQTVLSGQKTQSQQWGQAQHQAHPQQPARPAAPRPQQAGGFERWVPQDAGTEPIIVETRRAGAQGEISHTGNINAIDRFDTKAVKASLMKNSPPQRPGKDSGKTIEELYMRTTIGEQIKEYGAGALVTDENGGLTKREDQEESLEARVEGIQQLLKRFTDRMEYSRYNVQSGYSPEITEYFTMLMGIGVAADTAHELSRKAQKLVDSIQASPEKAMRKSLRELVGNARYIKCERGVCKKVMLIGPTGVGKTTTLAKLAANFAIKQNYSVGVINADIFRIAAEDQLNAYADIMSLPCITVSNSEELKDAFRQFEDKDLVLIDTTGRVSSDRQYQEQVRSFIEDCGVDQVFLTLSSITADRVLKEIIRQHSFIKDYGLIITKTDEDVSFGNFVNVCWYSGKKLGYFTTGQNVPDDICNVDIDELIERIMR